MPEVEVTVHIRSFFIPLKVMIPDEGGLDPSNPYINLRSSIYPQLLDPMVFEVAQALAAFFAQHPSELLHHIESVKYPMPPPVRGEPG